MDSRTRAILALGVVFLSVPLWAPALDVTGQDYVYERANVTVQDGTLAVDAPAGTPAPTDQVACFGYTFDERDRNCRLERSLLQGEASSPTNITVMRGTPEAEGAPFVVFGQRGQPYERTTAFDDDTGEYVLGLEPVEPATVLERASYDGDDRSGAIGAALETGQARSESPLDGPRLYAHDGGYALVYEDGQRQFLSAKPLVERGFEAIAMAIGAVLVFRAGRRR